MTERIKSLHLDELEFKNEVVQVETSQDEKSEEARFEEFQIDQLIEMIKNGNVRLSQEIIESETIDLNKQNEEGQTALMSAAENGRVRLLEMLIEKKVDLNKQNNLGETALIKAIQKGYNRVAQILIENDADLNLQTHKGLSALIIAVQKGDMDMVEGLVRKKADLDASDCYQLTSLMHAVQAGYLDISTLLIAAGCDMNKQDVTGKTAYDWARVFSQPACMHLIEAMQQEKLKHQESLTESKTECLDEDCVEKNLNDSSKTDEIAKKTYSSFVQPFIERHRIRE